MKYSSIPGSNIKSIGTLHNLLSTIFLKLWILCSKFSRMNTKVNSKITILNSYIYPNLLLK